jgi:hypothetical protein
MPNRDDDEDDGGREVTDYRRVLAYGDRAKEAARKVVAQGKRAAAPPKKQPSTAQKAKALRNDVELIYEDMILAPASKLALVETPHAKVSTTATGGRRIEHEGRNQTAMPRAKALKFIERFMIPIMSLDQGIPKKGEKYPPIGLHLILDIMQGKHVVKVSWATSGQSFGGTVTGAPIDAGKPGVGASSIILIDESAADWRGVPDLRARPDVGFLHELVHAWYNQHGLNDGSTEREAILVENRYRYELKLTMRDLP